MGKSEQEENRPSERVMQKEVQRSTSLASPQIFAVIRHEGVEELNRPRGSLAWSGVAAGFALSLSVYCQAFLLESLEGVAGAKTISYFGYTVGFVIVVLGRLQLFTENTITVILPLLSDFTRRRLLQTARLWAIVFAANLVGTFLSAWAALNIFPAAKAGAFLEVSHHLLDYGFWDCFLLGVPSGFLIAVMVWLMPTAKSAGFWVVIFITYFIAIGGMTHVIAGSTEYFLLSLDGEMPWLRSLFGGILPTLLGNIIGGTGLFALITYAQVRDEVKGE
ncbi:MAG TPA: formate/nitrite transporter family protein [Opitutales bacterium]|nr:formate/nitrite transporter family protein [Opitutales bacterium]